MTRKDYQVLAAALRKAYETVATAEGRDAFRETVDVLVTELTADNSRFNAKLFLKHIYGDKS